MNNGLKLNWSKKSLKKSGVNSRFLFIIVFTYNPTHKKAAAKKPPLIITTISHYTTPAKHRPLVKLIISRSHPAVCRTPVVQACYITSWVLLQPSALSGCPLAAYVSATAASSANVPSGNKQPSQRPSATHLLAEPLKIINSTDK